MTDEKKKREENPFEGFDEALTDAERAEAEESAPAEAEAGAGAADDALFFDLPDEEAGEAAADDATADEAAGDEDFDVDALAADEDLGGMTEADLLAAIDVEVSAEEQAEIERRSKLEWFTIHANTGHENKVKRNIEMAIKSNHMEESFGDVLVPVQEVTEMKNGKRVTTKRKFLPGYILVEMLMNKETHHFINSVPGVTGFIGGTPQKPQPVPRDEVDRILGRIKEPDEGKETLEIPYKVGDSVQVMDGPFSDWVGVINEINHEKGKLKVMISIFGKETPVELDFLQVKQV
jgi:transcriptional antiterminator NusG